MKSQYFFLVYFLLFTGLINAQTIQSNTATIINNTPSRTLTFNNSNGLGKTSTCGTDTMAYVFYKTTLFQALTMNNTTSGNIFAQWFPSPQSITVSGFDFYAWMSTGTSAVVTLTCRMYNSTFDSLPTGTPLASVTIPVDSTFGGGLLSVLKKRINFSTAVTTSNPYVLTIETSSSTNVAVVANSWTATPPNGRSEWLSSVKIGTTFVRGYNVNIAGVVFNADFIIQPYTSYSLTSNFTPSTLCNAGGGNSITFANTSSPVLFNRFYSYWAFQNLSQFSCIWDYGDTSGTYYAVNGQHNYNLNLPYKVTLKDTLYGWTRGCVDERSIILGVTPMQTTAYNNGPLCLGATLRLRADTVQGATYYWTGPNGFTSTQQNPIINNVNVSMIGNYSVRTVLGQCSSAVSQTYVNIISTLLASSNGPLCVGETMNLFATGVSGAIYAWTGPNSFISSFQNPVRTNVTTADSGLYSVTVTLAGCGTLGPYTTFSAVNVTPTTPTVSSNSPLCVGDNLNLNSSTLSGATYSWIGPNNFTSTQQNPTRASVLNSFSGTYSAKITKNGCTSQSGNTTVIINNMPSAPIAGNNGPLCIGQTLSLTATIISGATYLWSGPNNFSSSSQNPTRSSLTLSDAGTYSVIATTNGCSSPAATTTLVITSSTPAPIASSNAPLCPGQNLFLTASTIPNATYAWIGPDSFSSTQQNPYITNVTSSKAGIYSVTATTSACGTSSIVTVNVVINSLPAAPIVGNNSPLCEGQTLNLTASTITGATYSWSGPNAFTSTLQNPSVTGMNNSKKGQYSVFVNVSGCGNSPSASTIAIVHAVPSQPIPSSNAPICAGDTLRFNATSNTTGPNKFFTWSGPNNFASTNSNPVINNVSSINAGVYYLTVTDSGCTSNISSNSVTIKAIPASPVATSNAPICAGGNLFLYASSVSGATYNWSGPDAFTSIAQNPLISSVSTKAIGTYFVNAIVNGCSSVLSNVNVLINALPQTPTAGNNGPKCVGENISLSATTIPNVVYSWSGPSGFTSSQQNPVLVNATSAISGTYDVIVVSSNCASLPGSTDVVINPFPSPPSLSSNPAGKGCTGDSLQLFASFVNGASYEWSGPAGFGATKQNPVVYNLTNANAGNYSATITKGGCSSTPSTINIVIYQSPQTSAISGNVNVKKGDVENYSVNNSAGSTFDWIISNGNIQSGAGTNSINVSWIKQGNGLVTVRETNPNGCNGQLKQMNVTVAWGTGLNESQLERLRIYPNPADKIVTLDFDFAANSNIEIQFINLLGQEVLSKNFSNIGRKTLNVDIENLKSGVYFLNVKIADEMKVFKLLVE